ncbi:hypothetical protein DFJ73DRAFT_813826 [Zopfochytrium polystomum]|nr:hypothetical protein DFJ73DRAFT_813826 [Zopfochytrium polystomum]
MMATAAYPWQSEYQRQFTWKQPVSIPRRLLEWKDRADDPSHERVRSPSETPSVASTGSRASPVTVSVRLSDTPDSFQPLKHRRLHQFETGPSTPHMLDKSTQVTELMPDVERSDGSASDLLQDRVLPSSDRLAPHHDTPEGYKTRSKDSRQMINFGSGNVTPVNEDLYMRTFNVRAPPDQVYPSALSHRSTQATRERGVSRRRFDDAHQRSVRPPFQTSLRQRRLASHGGSLQFEPGLVGTFQTEYQREFLDWMGEIRKASH